MFLATTALSEFWNKNEEILFLGPWCILYNKISQISGLKYHVLPNPWSDRERFHQGYHYCQNLYEELLADLGGFLNQVQGVKFGPRYWRILVGPWLLHFIDIYYDRYVSLQDVIRQYPHFNTWLLDEQDYQVPLDLLEFITLALREEAHLYNLQLYSQILRSMGYTFPAKKAEKNISPGTERPGYAKTSLWSRCKEIARGARKLIYRSFFSRGEVWIHYSALAGWQQARLALTPGFQGRLLLADDLPPWRGPLEEKGESRRALAHFSHQGDSFRKILLENLPCNFPKLYLEGFGPWRRRMLQDWGQREFPKILVHAGGLWTDETAKLLAAEMSITGGKILGVQHGGGYGNARLHWAEKHERETSDRFACWGWAEQEQDDKLVNLAAPKLAYRERKPGQSRRYRTILIAGNTHPRYFHRFQSQAVGSQNEDGIQDLLTFMEELGETGRQATIYRGNPVEYGWNIPQRVRDRFPDVALDDYRQSFSGRMQNARLVVMDYPDTTFLEAMAANVPVVLFFDSRIWEWREEARRYFEVLCQAGVLLDTPGAAARQVRKIYDQVDDWWFSNEVQAARREFAQHFAMPSRNWPRKWVAWFNREIESLGEVG